MHESNRQRLPRLTRLSVCGTLSLFAPLAFPTLACGPLACAQGQQQEQVQASDPAVPSATSGRIHAAQLGESARSVQPMPMIEHNVVVQMIFDEPLQSAHMIERYTLEARCSSEPVNIEKVSVEHTSEVMSGTCYWIDAGMGQSLKERFADNLLEQVGQSSVSRWSRYESLQGCDLSLRMPGITMHQDDCLDKNTDVVQFNQTAAGRVVFATELAAWQLIDPAASDSSPRSLRTTGPTMSFAGIATFDSGFSYHPTVKPCPNDDCVRSEVKQ